VKLRPGHLCKVNLVSNAPDGYPGNITLRAFPDNRATGHDHFVKDIQVSVWDKGRATISVRVPKKAFPEATGVFCVSLCFKNMCLDAEVPFLVTSASKNPGGGGNDTRKRLQPKAIEVVPVPVDHTQWAQHGWNKDSVGMVVRGEETYLYVNVSNVRLLSHCDRRNFDQNTLERYKNDFLFEIGAFMNAYSEHMDTVEIPDGVLAAAVSQWVSGPRFKR